MTLSGTAVKTRGVDPGDLSASSAHGIDGGSSGDPTLLELSGVEEDASTGGIALTQSTPNPARDVATIHYALPGRGVVRIDLFDGNGRYVRTVDAGERASGAHDVTVRVDDLAVGVYHYRLTASGKSVTGTLTVVR